MTEPEGDSAITPTSPTGSAPGSPASDSSITVEQMVRTQLAKALGGPRGIVEAAVPTIVFTLTWLRTDQLRWSLAASVAVAVLALVIRLAQRQSVQFVMNAAFGIGIGALFAARSGRAADVFLPGLIYNAAYAVLLVGSVLIRWPLVGFLIGSVTGDPTGWRDQRGLVRLCGTLTVVLALPCLLRVLVQYPLYATNSLGWLATAKIAMGWPLQVAALAAMLAVLGRNRTPLEP